MGRYQDVIEGSPLFAGVNSKEVKAMMTCLKSYRRSYPKGEIIRGVGEEVDSLGLVLRGGALLTMVGGDGREFLLDHVGVGGVFGETASCLGKGVSDLIVTAAEPTLIQFFDLAKVLATCSSNCPFHQRVVRNLLLAVAKKNDAQREKLELLSKRTTREKLLCYLRRYAGEREGEVFTIPLKRQQLADYLCVNRSAMSLELCRLRDEGIIAFERNDFRFLKSPDDIKILS